MATAVVTGGKGALGGAVVAELAAAGWDVRVPDVTEVDLRAEAQVEAWYDAQGPIAASVHLVGGFAMAPLREASLADFEAMIDTNLRTCFLCCRAAARRMERGVLVNVAARPALEPRFGARMSSYAASKAGVVALTVALAEELAPAIRVNAVAPGIIDTPANRAAMPDADRSRWVAPEAIARVIRNLVATDNVVSGAVLPLY